MTKKQNAKKKVTVKVLPGQAIYVADLSRFEHIISVYESLAHECVEKEEKEAWTNIILDIQQWMQDTYYNPEGSYEEEW